MSSAREIDLNPRTYVGLSFPLRADNKDRMLIQAWEDAGNTIADAD